MLSKEEIILNVEINSNKLVVSCEPYSEEYLYAFQLFCNGNQIDRVLYSEQNETVFWLSQSGEYTVRGCIKNAGKSVANISEPIEFQNAATNIPITEIKKVNIFNRVYEIAKEIISNFPMLMRIAKYDYKLLNKDAYLGRIWNVLTPLIQIGIYWLVFGIGIRNGSDVDGHPFILWMLCGLVPWFFANHSINKGATSIYGKANVVTKMKYPIATVPVQVIVTGWMEHIMLLAIFLVMLIINGYYPTFYYLNLIYYMVYAFFFLSSLALITSVLVMLARDFEKLLSSITRLLFYLTPILWSMDKMPDIYQDILKFNPILYIVTGFRDSVLYQVNFWEHPRKLIFFWGINIILFIVGCDLQYRYRRKFNDLL